MADNGAIEAGGLVPTDLEWAIGDAMNAAAATEAMPYQARNEAAKATRRDVTDVTWIGRTCAAFPAQTRRLDLPFELHRAVVALPDDQRLPMLQRAAASGWSVRETRRQVLSARIEAGTYFPLQDDDVEDQLYRRVAQAWNRAPIAVRQMFVEAQAEVDLGDIIL